MEAEEPPTIYLIRSTKRSSKIMRHILTSGNAHKISFCKHWRKLAYWPFFTKVLLCKTIWPIALQHCKHPLTNDHSKTFQFELSTKNWIRYNSSYYLILRSWLWLWCIKFQPIFEYLSFNHLEHCVFIATKPYPKDEHRLHNSKHWLYLHTTTRMIFSCIRQCTKVVLHRLISQMVCKSWEY